MARHGLGLGGVCAQLCLLLAHAVRLKSSESLELLHGTGLGHTLELRHRLGSLNGADTSGGVDCTKFPHACKAPFNCHLPRETRDTVATRDGHVDWRTWCSSPNYVEAVSHCREGDLRAYGRIIHAAQNNISKYIEFLDSHYCFAHGHCDNFNITPNTTLAEAETMCDERFGHERWTRMGNMQSNESDLLLTPKLHLSERAEMQFVLTACAMGNYHCDAIYCQQEFCDKPRWRRLWGDARPSDMVALHGQNYPPGRRH